MTDLWYYAEGEETRGPLSIDELIPLLVRISDPRRIMIWRHGFDDWKPVEEVREVAQQVFRPPPLKPGPPPIPPASAPLVREPVVASEDAAQLGPIEHSEEKWSLWGAANAGLVFSAALLWMSALTTESYKLAAHSPSVDSVAYLFGYLSGAPILFVMVAAIRNAARHRKLRPSSASGGKRALMFFAILIAVLASLKIYSAIYFSRDDVVSGEARTGIVKSFLSGCIPSARAKTANSGVTDAQIDNYCNCVASSVGSTLTYRQLGMSNVEDYVRQAIVAAAPSCQVRR
jgi:hypothetical protein